MKQLARSRAEEQFAATQKRAERVLSEQEQDRQRLMERTMRLRSSRVAKEAAERAVAKNK